MANVGLKDLYYAPITEDASGNETYGTPVKIAPAITAALNFEWDEFELHADDKIEDDLRQFKRGTISLGVSAITSATAAYLTGATVDSNGCLVDAVEDEAPYVAIGFRSLTTKGTYEYVWLYRVKFAVPNRSYNTKGDSISAVTPTIEGKIYKRNKPDSRGKTVWRNTVTEGESSNSATVISTWFTAVPEPTY